MKHLAENLWHVLMGNSTLFFYYKYETSRWSQTVNPSLPPFSVAKWTMLTETACLTNKEVEELFLFMLMTFIIQSEALFSSEKFLDLATIAFLFYLAISDKSWTN